MEDLKVDSVFVAFFADLYRESLEQSYDESFLVISSVYVKLWSYTRLDFEWITVSQACF